MTTKTPVLTDPAAFTASQWSARLAALCRERGSDDPDVIAARQALSYHRVHRVVDREVGELSPVGVDLLVTELREAVAHQ